MKIAIDARWIFPEISGIGLYTRELVAALAEVDRVNEYVLLFDRPELQQRTWAEAQLADKPNFRFVVVPWRIFSPAGQLGLPGWLRREGIEVFHSPNYMIPFRAFPRRRPHAIRCVVTIHDLIPLLFPQYTPRALKTRFLFLFKALLRETAARADAVLTVSEASRADILRLLNACNVVAIPNGVAPQYQPVSPPRNSPKRILFVGRFDPYKNVLGLMAAFDLLRQQLPGAVRLVIAGAPDPRYPEPLNFARQRGLEKDIEWLGYVSGPQLVAAYQQADVFVLPSRCEGFGLPVVEAMACGTPVVCSRVSSLPEVAGDAALLITPDDAAGIAQAIRRVLEEPKLAATLREKGIRRAAKFSWRHAAEMTRQVYEQAGRS
jgi:alpha-1,3-rhamnosyl/mannosyltransferase